MPTLLQINIFAGKGSTGRIAEEVGGLVKGLGWESYIAHGRGAIPGQSEHISIGRSADIYFHLLESRLLDRQGLGSRKASKNFIEKIKRISPDIIHLHNIHGYYLNYEILFEYLSSVNIPVVWTLHDCWSFTGHCAYYSYEACNKWISGCNNCPQLQEYPKSLFWDRSSTNYQLKRHLFTKLLNLTMVPVSYWLAGELQQSFLKANPVQVIHNGIDVVRFSPRTQNQMDLVRLKYGLGYKFICLGVSLNWPERKGLKDFIKIRQVLPAEFEIVLVGLTQEQSKNLPDGITAIERTDSVDELAALYSLSSVLINPTWEDNYPTINLESISCGTPVITYKTGGSPESITEATGFIVNQGDINAVVDCVQLIKQRGNEHYTSNCRSFAIRKFDKNICFDKYLQLYNSLLR